MKDCAANASGGPVEMVPNHWLRSVRASPLVSDAALDGALAHAGLVPDALDEGGTVLPLYQEIAVLDALVRQSADPVFAIRLGQTSEARTGSILSYIIFSSPTVRAALGHMCELSRITRPRSRVSTMACTDGVELRMQHPDPLVQMARPYKEFAVASVLHALNDATEMPLPVRRVVFSFHPSPHRNAVARAFGCPVEYGADYTGILLGPSALESPVKSCDHCLLDHLTGYGRMLLARQRDDPDGVRERVFRLLMCRLTGGVPRLAAVARELALSPRTLSRRLAEEGTTYRDLVDAARAGLAHALLDDPTLSLTQISYLLGFADQSSFTHAYRRWTGQPPTRARLYKQGATLSLPVGGRRQAFGR